MTARTYAQDILEKLKKGSELTPSSLRRDEQSPLPPLEFVKNQIDLAPASLRPRLQLEFFHLGPIEVLVQDPDVTEIILHTHQIVFEKQGLLHLHDDFFLTDYSHQQFVHRICDESGVHTTLTRPFIDGCWREFRLHMMQSPICDEKWVITLRRHSRHHWTLDRLLEAQFVTAVQKDTLADVYQNKKNILIVGPTGSGKTTLINALLLMSHPTERVIVIEDTDELVKPNAASVKLLTRPSGQGSLPEVTLNDLLKQSLRMRPDRLLVGEVRSEEAKDLLLTLSTGHSGFVGTLHAKSTREALWRLEMLIQMGAPQWSLETIRKLIFSSLFGIVVIDRGEGHRRVCEMKKIAGLEPSGFLLENF